MDQRKDGESSRVIVFAQLRSTVADVARYLKDAVGMNDEEPFPFIASAIVDACVVALCVWATGVRAHEFVGQSSTAGFDAGNVDASAAEAGLNQREQALVLRKFRKGDYNVLVATCVAEEGLGR